MNIIIIFLVYGLESISDNSVLRSAQVCWSRILLRVLKITVRLFVIICRHFATGLCSWFA